MDVTCDRCGTDYEFEEALVSTRGTTVKCTQCGHLFKVYKPTGASDPRAGWMVRRLDGSSQRLPSLADLTRLIGEGALGREDELSRTGKAWKRLGEIAELRAYFERAQAAGLSRARRVSPLGPRAELPAPAGDVGVAAVPLSQPAATVASSGSGSQPEAASPAAFDAVSTKGLYDSQRSIPRPAPRLRRESPFDAQRPVAAVSVQAARTSAGPAREEAAARSPSAPVAAPGGTPPSDGEADDGSQPGDSDPTQIHPGPFRVPAPSPAEPAPAYEPYVRSKGNWPIWPFVVGSAVLVVGWLAWPALLRFAPQPALTRVDPAVQYLERADALFASHRVARFAEAAFEYTKAIGLHESDPHIRSTISRVHAVWAQELLFQAADLEREIGANPDPKARTLVFALGREALWLGEQAKHHGEQAARKSPGNREAEVALADALRLTNNLVGARSELDRPNEGQDSPSGESLRVAALLAIAEAGGDLRAGVALASQAVERDPDLIRARLLLARCLFAASDPTAARQQLHAVMTIDRNHPGVHEIEAGQDAARAAPASTPSTVSAAHAPDPPALEPEEEQRGFEDLNHEAYIARARKQLESGHVGLAKRTFEQALFIRPSSAEAHAGLGFVALETNRLKVAIAHFLEAKRAGSPEAYIGLGEVYRRSNRQKEALKAYSNYISEFPQGPQLSIARAQLEQLSEDAGAGKK